MMATKKKLTGHSWHHRFAMPPKRRWTDSWKGLSQFQSWMNGEKIGTKLTVSRMNTGTCFLIFENRRFLSKDATLLQYYQTMAEESAALLIYQRLNVARQLRTFCETFITALESRLSST
jgi:hypothetical protein